MLSESARVTTAQEARYRIPYPNSKERAHKIIALDAESAQLVDEVAKKEWHGVRFFSSLSFETGDPQNGELKGWLNDIAGRTMDLLSEIKSADSVMVICAAGSDARAVSVIAEGCKLHNKTLVGLIMPHASSTDEEISTSLNYMRPYTRMLVLGGGVDFIEAMLTALRA